MNKYTVDYDGRIFANMTVAELAAKGVPSLEIGAAVKAVAKDEITTFAETYRTKISTSSAGKLAEYRFKEEIARDPEGASETELALIIREATARGISRDELLAIIGAQAAAYRQIALLIGVLEAEASAAISAIPDDAAYIETQTLTVLGAAKAQAETAFNEALALINGGS